MGRIVVTEYISIDGVVEAPSGTESFDRVGWTDAFGRGAGGDRRYDGDIVVHGSPQLAHTLIEHDLVDALHLQVYPVIVGAGKRLFGETSATKRLRLIAAKTVSDVHILIYERDDRARLRS